MQNRKVIAPASLSGRLRHLLHYGDRPWQALLLVVSAIVVILMLAIGGLLWINSSAARSAFGWSFLTPTASPNWNPVSDQFQAWPFLYGTLLTSLFAILFALPIGIGIAIFLAELSPSWLRTPLTWLVELLAAIPSVVYGLWGIFVFLPKVVAPVGVFLGNTLGKLPLLGLLFSGPTPASGSSRLAASLILTIMIIPTIAAVSRDVFLAIPASQREAARALGATEWETIWQVLIPYGRSGILGAVILGLGRALGETMSVTMVIGNSIQAGVSLLQPGYSMASIIANEFAEAVSKLHTAALIEIGLVLFIITLLLNIVARVLVWQVARQASQEARS